MNISRRKAARSEITMRISLLFPSEHNQFPFRERFFSLAFFFQSVLIHSELLLWSTSNIKKSVTIFILLFWESRMLNVIFIFIITHTILEILDITNAHYARAIKLFIFFFTFYFSQRTNINHNVCELSKYNLCADSYSRSMKWAKQREPIIIAEKW